MVPLKEVLFLCPSCFKTSVAPIKIADLDGFTTATIRNNAYRCPVCGAQTTLNKENLLPVGMDGAVIDVKP